MAGEASDKPADELVNAWRQAARRVWPAIVALIALIGEGLAIFVTLSFLTLLDRSFLFLAAAFATSLTISLLASAQLSTRLFEVRGRLAAVSREMQRADEVAQKVPALEATNAVLSRSLADASTRIANVELQRDELARRVSDLEKEREEWVSTRARLDQRIAAQDREIESRGSQIRQLNSDLSAERTATTRAGFIPSMDVTFGTTGFGILAPKTVHADVRNLGPGVAREVEFSAALGSGSTIPAYSPIAYWTAMDRGATRRVVLGDTTSLSRFEWVRCKITYGSQFGPCPNIDVVYTPQ